MQAARSRRLKRRRRLGALFLLLTIVSTIPGLPAAVEAAPATPSFGPSIDAYAPRQPQRTCDPTAKPGVAAFRDLLLATYLSTKSLGITRACASGGASEHKEGRALDWGADIGDAQDRAAVDDVIGWLLATDRHGNQHALFRRLGIMYMIWNRRIWTSTSRSWTAYTGSNAHTDHVHFSFSWDGALQRTSWWAGAPVSAPPGGVSTFDGDVRLDRVAYSVHDSNWNMVQSSNGLGVTHFGPGGPGQMPVPGDYDHDGRIDRAVFSVHDGMWNTVDSSTGLGVSRFGPGGPGQVPVPGDYDHDGKLDRAVYSITDAMWNIVSSSTGLGVSRFGPGGPGQVPVPGDYDNDGQLDRAVYSPNDAAWHAVLSSTGGGFMVIGPGGPRQVPVPADYDNDGRLDRAVYSPDDSAWNVVLSTTGLGVTMRGPGGPGQIPAVGDYDHDGRLDRGAYSPTDSAWNVVLSSTGLGVTMHGPGGVGQVSTSAKYSAVTWLAMGGCPGARMPGIAVRPDNPALCFAPPAQPTDGQSVAAAEPVIDVGLDEDVPTAAPSFTASTPPAAATVGTPYSYTYVASGSPAPGFSVTGGALPPGMSLNGSTGSVSGTPFAAGSFTFTVTAANGIRPDAVSASTTITVAAMGMAFHPLTPARVLDSRPSGPQVGPYATPWSAGQRRDVTVAGVGGVPAGAAAVALNVTVTGTTASSFLTVWPAGQAQPLASNLNWTAGQTIPNAVTVKVGSGGSISMFNSAGSSDVIVDAVGYYDTNPGDGFTSLTPSRILDSRPSGPQVGPFGTPWGPNQTRDVTVAGEGGVPAGADGVVVNVTVTGATAAGYLTLWPAGQPRPRASSLNWVPGQTIPNAVTVKVGAGGRISVFNPVGEAHVIIDVVGSFAPGTGHLFRPLSPVRIQDSRPSGPQVGPHSTPWGPNVARDVQLGGAGGVPAGAAAVLMNVTATGTTAASYLTIWPSELTAPVASSLNWASGDTIPNSVTARPGATGAISMKNASGNVHIIADVAGWYG